VENKSAKRPVRVPGKAIPDHQYRSNHAENANPEVGDLGSLEGRIEVEAHKQDKAHSQNFKYYSSNNKRLYRCLPGLVLLEIVPDLLDLLDLLLGAAMLWHRVAIIIISPTSLEPWPILCNIWPRLTIIRVVLHASTVWRAAAAPVGALTSGTTTVIATAGAAAVAAASGAGTIG
jgi:hypothetical protein